MSDLICIALNHFHVALDFIFVAPDLIFVAPDLISLPIRNFSINLVKA